MKEIVKLRIFIKKESLLERARSNRSFASGEKSLLTSRQTKQHVDNSGTELINASRKKQKKTKDFPRGPVQFDTEEASQIHERMRTEPKIIRNALPYESGSCISTVEPACLPSQLLKRFGSHVFYAAGSCAKLLLLSFETTFWHGAT